MNLLRKFSIFNGTNQPQIKCSHISVCYQHRAIKILKKYENIKKQFIIEIYSGEIKNASKELDIVPNIRFDKFTKIFELSFTLSSILVLTTEDVEKINYLHQKSVKYVEIDGKTDSDEMICTYSTVNKHGHYKHEYFDFRQLKQYIIMLLQGGP